MTDPNELTRWDRVILEAGVTCVILETRDDLTSAAADIAALDSFQIIEAARLMAEAQTTLRTFERWAALKSRQL
jgi:hypothetical protein